MTMTKKQAEQQFKELFKEVLQSNDKPLKRMTWNDFIDSLNKNGQITDKQATTWTQPKFINN